jgi:hypothetical protein
MQLKQFTSLSNPVKFFSATHKISQVLAIGGLAIGAAAIAAAPAGAVVITNGQLAFNDGALLESGSITTAGGNFTVNFNRGGNAIVTNADGGFGALIPGVVNPAPSKGVPIAASTGVNFSYTAINPAATGGSFTATLLSALSYDFGTTIGSVNISPGATFTGLYLAPGAGGVATGRSFFNFTSGTTTFLSGTATTGGAQLSQLALTSFNFDVDNAVTGNASPNGAYSLVANAVPEPFTIIGTIVGGTAALRMRKKLLNAVNK